MLDAGTQDHDWWLVSIESSVTSVTLFLWRYTSTSLLIIVIYVLQSNYPPLVKESLSLL